MDNDTIKARSRILKDTIVAKGACLTGFADISCLGLPMTRQYPFAICFGLRHNDDVINQLSDDELWDRMSLLLTEKAGAIYGEIQKLLQSWDFHFSRVPSTTRIDELPIPGEILPEKTIATLSGLGWIGKSSLLITPEYGPRVRFGTLLTDMPLETNTPVTQSQCGDCTACVDVCPVHAIEGRHWSQETPRSEILDVSKCYHHLWSKK